MIKFIKKIFNTDNLDEAMVYVSLSNPNISSSEFVRLSYVLRNMYVKNTNINTEVNLKKVA